MLSISNASKIQGGEILYSKVTFQINRGEKIGLVGPNGSGKSTLLKIIIGEDKFDEGEIALADKARASYFSQKIGELRGPTVLEYAMSGDEELIRLGKELREYETRLSDPNLDPDTMNEILMKMGDCQSEFEARDGYDLESRAQEVLSGLGIAEDLFQLKIEKLSGGQKMRATLARTLISSPDLILMDEPTNYLDLETIIWLEEWLQNYKGALLMTTHDQYFMNNVCNRIIGLDYKLATLYSGNFDFYQKEKQDRLEKLKSEFKKQQDRIAKDKEFIARFKARASHAAQVQSRVKKLEKVEIVEIPSDEESISFEFPSPPRGSDQVLVAEDISKSWGEKTIFSKLGLKVSRGEKIAVVGRNGAGKSTLLNVLAGNIQSDAGKVEMGPSIQCGYFGEKSANDLGQKNDLIEELHSFLPGKTDGYIRNLLAAFLFKGDDVFKKVGVLSGGEKSRLLLSLLLAKENNLLILDEPTNHLDLSSRMVLLETLQKYTGTIIFVSHDRYFLKHLANKVLEVDQSQVIQYPGDFNYYLDKKERE